MNRKQDMALAILTKSASLHAATLRKQAAWTDNVKDFFSNPDNQRLMATYAVPTLVGAGIGAAVDKKKRLRGAILGGLLGAGAGGAIHAGTALYDRYKTNKQMEQTAKENQQYLDEEQMAEKVREHDENGSYEDPEDAARVLAFADAADKEKKDAEHTQKVLNDVNFIRTMNNIWSEGESEKQPPYHVPRKTVLHRTVPGLAYALDNYVSINNAWPAYIYRDYRDLYSNGRTGGKAFREDSNKLKVLNDIAGF